MQPGAPDNAGLLEVGSLDGLPARDTPEDAEAHAGGALASMATAFVCMLEGAPAASGRTERKAVGKNKDRQGGRKK